MPCIVIRPSLLLQLQVEEMFAVIDAVRTVVVYSQTTYESTAQGGLQRLVLLATSVLEPKKPLKVKHVPLIGQKESDIAPPALRPHDELTEVGAATREAFAKAVATRFVVPRYGKGLSSHSHRYDMAIFLSPGGRSMKYLDTLKSSTVGELGGFVKPASEVKERIVDQARAILIEGIAKARAMAKTTPVDVELDTPSAKRFKSAVDTADDPQQAAFKAAGVMDSSSDEETEPAGNPDITPKQEADSVLFKWQKTKVGATHCCCLACVAGYVGVIYSNVFCVYAQQAIQSRPILQTQAFVRLVFAIGTDLSG